MWVAAGGAEAACFLRARVAAAFFAATLRTRDLATFLPAARCLRVAAAFFAATLRLLVTAVFFVGVLDSYRFIRKQEYFNKFKLLGAVERCFGWNDRLCGMQFRACCLAVVL